MRLKVLCTTVLILTALTTWADDSGWPKKAVHPKATVTLYQPQIEKMTENDIESRAAVSVTLTGETEPHFGAVWITARVEVDRDSRIVRFRQIQIPEVRFPEASDENKALLASFLEEEITRWDLEVDLDLLIPLMELAEHNEPRDAGFKHDPPTIVVSKEPAVLVLIDGEPRRNPVSGPKKAVKKNMEQVINSPNLLVYHPSKKTYYLSGGGKLWYTATDVLGPYEPTHRVPSAVKAMLSDEAGEADTSDETPPEIITATSPTELIVLDGEPEYGPIGELELLYATNTESYIVVGMATRRHFVLLSGRWYVSEKGLDGPWQYVDPQELPQEFAEIPADSPMAAVLAHVPGTVQAREANLDNIIPQTAAIRRDDTSLKVEYDGQPRFEDVEESSIQYAVNSPQSVLKVGSRYYCCEQAVWYESSSATGPWTVCTVVPDEVYTIPASNPHHNVTYVNVYDVTPTVVYTGYTPGYVGSYYHGGCVIYGTGWYYPGWYGRYYYPRPSTWGFHASYNPWYGWGFGISWSSGPFSFYAGSTWWGPSYRHPGWWGPWGYRPYYRPYPSHPIYRPGGGRPYPPAGSTRPPGGGPSVRPRPGTPGGGTGGGVGAVARPSTNLYSQDRNSGRLASQPGAAGRSKPGVATGTPNNMYTDRSGNVYRQGAQGWEQRSGGSWSPSPGQGAKPSTPPRSGGSNLNSHSGARSRGTTRSNQFRSSPRPSSPRPSGGGMRSSPGRRK